MKLYHKVALGMLLGGIFGYIFPDHVHYLYPVGEIFINLIKMIVIPLVLFAIIAGVTSITDTEVLGRVGKKSAIAYLTTSTLAIMTGLVLAHLIDLGSDIDLNLLGSTEDTASFAIAEGARMEKSVMDILLDAVPSNIFASMVQGNTVHLVFFAIFVGVTINIMGEEAERLVNFCQLMSKIFIKMVSYIVRLSPYAAFAITAWTIGEQGLETVRALFKLMMSVALGMGIQYLVFGVLILIFARISPIPFYKKSITYQMIAFATSSGKATLATTMEVCQNDLGISRTSTSFVLPLGASINMDGMAIYLGMCAVFFANATGIVLSAHDYVLIIITSTFATIGVAGVPAGSMIMLPMILSSINVPIEGLALIAGIDRILDMLRSVVSITGDAAITLIIDRSEKKLNLKRYYKYAKSGRA